MANSLSLDSLRDVHVPPHLGWWPPAPGWCILAVLILIGMTIAVIWFVHCYQCGRFKREALAVLTQYHQQSLQDHNPNAICAQISELLKRVALTYYPHSHVAGLQGQPWLDFLNTSAKTVDFNSVRTLLLEYPFQPNNLISLNPDDLELLFKCARRWIKNQGKPCLN